MCLAHNITVSLYKSGRYFYCPYCHRSHQHPPFDLKYYMIGYGFCDLYMSWFPIAGGDGLGIVKVNGNCERYTVRWGKENPCPHVEEQTGESALA